MVELADIFRRYGPDYINHFGNRMLPSHRRALHDIAACRTEQMGGHLYCCENPDCEQLVYAYHSCGNRSCPKCGQDKAQSWLEKQHNRLLPTHYFLVTFTVPDALRKILRANGRVCSGGNCICPGGSSETNCTDGTDNDQDGDGIRSVSSENPYIY